MQAAVGLSQLEVINKILKIRKEQMLLYRVIIGSLLFILSVLPLKTIRFVGKILGRILFLIPNRHKIDANKHKNTC